MKEGYAKQFVVSFEEEVSTIYLMSLLAMYYPHAGVRTHDLGECAEKHKEEMEALLVDATKRLGW